MVVADRAAVAARAAVPAAEVVGRPGPAAVPVVEDRVAAPVVVVAADIVGPAADTAVADRVAAAGADSE